MTSPHTGPYAPPRTPPPPRPRASRGHVALVVGGVVVLALGVVAAITVALLLGRSVVRSAFGTCEHTPAVAAAVETDLREQGYEVLGLEYDCSRDPAAQVVADEALLRVEPPGGFGSADEVVVALRHDLSVAGWLTRPDDEGRAVLGLDGYGVTVDVHSSQPALVLLTLRRDVVGGDTPWDGQDGSAVARELSPQDLRRFALLPDLTPTWAPNRFGDWSTRYRLERTAYLGSTGRTEDGTSLEIDVHRAPADPAETCAQPGACAVVGTASNGVVVQQVLPRAPGSRSPLVAGHVDGAYVARVDDVLVTLTARRTAQPGDDAGPPRADEVLDVDEVLRVFGSVDADAIAPAR